MKHIGDMQVSSSQLVLTPLEVSSMPPEVLVDQIAEQLRRAHLHMLREYSGVTQASTMVHIRVDIIHDGEPKAEE